MPCISRPFSLPEELTSIICDHHVAERQLRALATMMQLNHRVSTYARRAMYTRFDFIDNRTSRVLANASDLEEAYQGGELLDEDILAAVDNQEVDPLDLDPALRWLRDMRTCRTIEVRDLLYGRDIGSLSTLAETLARQNIVLFPQVRQVIISAKIVKQILAQDTIVRAGRRGKELPLGLLVVLFLATRSTTLCLQDSAIFTPPPTQRFLPHHVTQIQEEINGRLVPVRTGHISRIMNQWIKGMKELQEIRYHAVDPKVPIFPKKGIKHIVTFKAEPPPSASDTATSSAGPSSSAFSMFASIGTTYADHLPQAMKDMITRSMVLLPEPGPPAFTDREEDDSSEEEEAERPRRPAYSNGGDEAVVAARKQSQWRFILPYSKSPDGTCLAADNVEREIREWGEEKYSGVLKDEVLHRLEFGLKEDEGKCGICDCKS